mgnify:CR=1 FL=1
MKDLQPAGINDKEPRFNEWMIHGYGGGIDEGGNVANEFTGV